MKSTTYFPGLHALRFFAATLVIIHHVEQYKAWQGKPNVWGHQSIDQLGHLPVGFFFVLSGFLITYFLLIEAKENSFIKLKSFYWKRVIRLWPVYFVVVIIALNIIPFVASGFHHSHFEFGLPVLLCLFLFIPNVLRLIHPNLVGGNQLWSIGVEEQFYLVWPLLIGLFHKHIFRFLLLFIGTKLCIQSILGFAGGSSTESLYFLLKLFPVEQMAIGGIGAAMILSQSRHLKKFLADWVFALAILALTFRLVVENHFWGQTLVEGILFLIIILNVVYRPAIYNLLENRSLKKLGDASYGIYMYHTLVIALVMTGLSNFQMSSLSYSAILYVVSITLTIAIARFSFVYFEKPLLKFKNLNFRLRKNVVSS